MPGYASLPRATSDSRPWPRGGNLAVCTNCGAIQKFADAKWIEEADKIYSTYEIYHQSGGSEHLIFSQGGAPKTRSQKLLDYVVSHAKLPDRGKLLDIGCGNGATLRSFSEILPAWDLYGNELSTATLADLEKIAKFNRLFVGPLRDIHEQFSLISLVHTLEHVPSPHDTLLESSAILDDDGFLFVQVPDVETSPFDLLVADHFMHFSQTSLGYVAARSGLRVAAMSNGVTFKEITMLAGRGDAGDALGQGDPERGLRVVTAAVKWLEEVVSMAERAAASGPIGIFGTAIAAMALYGALKDRVTFFVDEDPNRIGRHYDGKPIFAPDKAPKNVPVFMALPFRSAEMIAQRCRRDGLTCVVPPDPETIGAAAHA